MATTDKNTIYSWFQTDDFPTEDQFRATWDSFWHKSESIPMSQITGLNQLFQQTATVAQLNNKANVDGSNIDVSAYQEKLNITNLIATAKEEVKTELLNGAPEAFDTLKEISDWISDDETAEAAILQAIQNEATARTEADNQKLDKGNYIGTAQDLYNYFEGKIDAGYNCIPVVGNGASGKVLTNSVVSQIYGKVGIDIAGEASEKLEVNGNVKAIDFKGQSIKFNLQASITPTPNTLVPKTDGSSLIWYNNSSIENNIPFLPYNWVFGLGSGSLSSNTAIGFYALSSNTGGNDNTAIGYYALANNTIGYSNTAIGFYALSFNNGGNENTAIGCSALSFNNGGDKNTAIGCYALLNNSGDNNTAIGYYALSSNTGGNGNTAIGYYALASNNNGLRNVAVGNYSQKYSSGKDNCSFGESSLVWAGGAVNNSVFGSGSGYTCNGDSNSAFGYNSLYFCTGANNVAIGALSAYNIGSGNKCVFIGAADSISLSTPNSTNMIAIGFNVAGKGSNTVELGNDSISNTYLKGKVNLNNRLKLASYTKAQRDALTNKEVGDMIWQTDSGNSGIRVFDGTNWLAVQTVID